MVIMEDLKLWETLIQLAENQDNISSIDVHGLYPMYAEMQIDQFIESSILSGDRVIKIIHGIGTGILSNVITKLLQNHWAVLYFRDSLLSGEGSAVKYVVLFEN